MEQKKMKKSDRDKIAVFTVLLFIVNSAGWLLIGNKVFIISIPLLAMLIFFILFDIYRKLYDSLNRHYQQLESLFSIFSVIRPKIPLPDIRGWTASPDFLKKISEIILINKPELVVEASSGVSTLIIAYCLKHIGKGKVISLEHDLTFAEATRDMISAHGLSDFATIVHAPLKEVEIDHSKWLWYDTDGIHIEQPVDLVVVDGPPKRTQNLARYPALPLLYKWLSDTSTIILDDGKRASEKQTVARWQKEFRNLSCNFIELEKGAFIIKLKAAL